MHPTATLDRLARVRDTHKSGSFARKGLDGPEPEDVGDVSVSVSVAMSISPSLSVEGLGAFKGHVIVVGVVGGGVFVASGETVDECGRRRFGGCRREGSS
jgi:hypothetical protein